MRKQNLHTYFGQKTTIFLDVEPFIFLPEFTYFYRTQEKSYWNELLKAKNKGVLTVFYHNRQLCTIFSLISAGFLVL